MWNSPLAVMFKDENKKSMICYDYQTKKFFLISTNNQASNNIIILTYYIGLAIYSFISNIGFIKKFINMSLNVDVSFVILVSIIFGVYRTSNFYKSLLIRLQFAKEYRVENIQQTIYGIENTNQGFWFSIAKYVLLFIICLAIYLTDSRTVITNYCLVVTCSDLIYAILMNDIYRRFKLKKQLQRQLKVK